jgi:hypothetical protein
MDLETRLAPLGQPKLLVNKNCGHVFQNTLSNIPYDEYMTTAATIIFEELSSKMKRSLKDAVSRNDDTVDFEGNYRLDSEAQAVLGIPGSPFAGAVYEPNTRLGSSPACYVISDEIVELLAR